MIAGYIGEEPTEMTQYGSLPTDTRVIIMQVGTSLDLRCSLEAVGNHHPVWTREEQLITSGDKYVIRARDPSVLIIQNTGKHHN